MQTNALDGANGQSQLLRQLMQMARANANQEDASGGASSAQSAQGDQGGQQATPPAPPAAGATPADMFSGSTLGALTSTQEGDWRQQMDANLANKMIGQLDTDGDGSLNLSEIENALGVATSGATSATDASSSATTAQDKLSAAFAQVDTNGDGQLSADELTSALGQMQTQHAHGHGHRHHGGAPPNALAGDSTGSTTGIDGTAADDPSIATTAATSSSSSSTSSSSAPGLTAADIAQAVQAFATQLQQQVASLEAQLQSPSGSTSVTA